jgi:hypothetical protein
MTEEVTAMKKTVLLALLAGFSMAGCGDGSAPSTAETVAVKSPWPEFVATAVDEYYRRNPESAVYAGLHEFDGQMSDASPGAIDDYAEWLDQVIAAAQSYADLDGMQAFERDYLVASLDGQRFWIRATDYWTKNPLSYINAIGVSVYVDREYAPPEQRLEAYTAYVSRIPAHLDTMKSALEPPLPLPYVVMGHAILTGLADYFANTVPGQFAAVDEGRLLQQFHAANGAAVDAIRDAADWLDGLRATASDDYALGEERFLEMLKRTEGIEISLAELKAAGEADLARNLEMLAEACAEFAPGAGNAECIARMQDRKSPEGAVGGAQRQLPGLKKFLLDNDIVSIPSDEEALVAEAPPHRRFNLAYINIPGPFERGLPSTYFIAPPDPAWSEEDQRAYVVGEADLLAVSVHEVWPGHFLHYLHSNRAGNAVGRHFGTYTFSEGWAHYTEEMMVDAGLGDGDPEVRIGQIQNALLRNVRFLSAIGLHTEGMTVEESQRMFEEKAFKDMGNARQQAYRGTYDPGYLNYTLGKLMINKLRDDWTMGRGGREAWGRFHDEFLSYGAPPIPLVRERMLGPDYDGDPSLLPD